MSCSNLVSPLDLAVPGLIEEAGNPRFVDLPLLGLLILSHLPVVVKICVFSPAA